MGNRPHIFMSFRSSNLGSKPPTCAFLWISPMYLFVLWDIINQMGFLTKTHRLVER